VPTPASTPDAITTGPDGNLWFTERAANQLGRVNDDGTITEFAVPTRFSSPTGITAGPDGNVWFTEAAANRLGRVNSDGSITEFPLPTRNAAPLAIIAGPDGNLWFTENGANQLGSMDPNNPDNIQEFPTPTPYSHPFGITAGPDGNIWFTENSSNQIGQYVFGGPAPGPAPQRPPRLSEPVPNGPGEGTPDTAGTRPLWGHEQPLSPLLRETSPAAVETLTAFQALAHKQQQDQWCEGIEAWSWDVPASL
jgi:hypothetical protein